MPHRAFDDDRHLQSSTLPWAVGVSFVLGPFMIVGAVSTFGGHWWAVPLGVAFVALTFVAVLRLPVIVANATGRGADYVLAGGSGTPYEEQFSHEDALIMRRDYDTALALLEQRFAGEAPELRAIVRAADLCAGEARRPERAAELYRMAQRHPALPAGTDIYVTNRLVDLLLGPLHEPQRALVELRRITVSHPRTQAAEHARQALASLKRDLFPEDVAPSA